MSTMSNQGPYTVPLSVGHSTVGGPMYFTHGPFSGKIVRTAAAELQKADAGRKFARKDKRPLDPPPVVQVRFFEVFDAGTMRHHEREIVNYDDTLTLGLVCLVDLFPVVVESAPEGNTRHRTMPDLLAASSFANPASTSTSSGPIPGWLEPGTSAPPLNNFDIVAYYGNYPIRESSNSTSILAGARVTTPITIDHNNREVLAFTFNDLAVQQEGTFTLRYCIVDILSKTTDDGGLTHRVPILASCFGGIFKIWSTKTFPGLSGSTPLTKRLSLLGAPVNIRSADHKIGKGRKKQKTGHTESAAEGTASSSQPGSPETPSSPEAHVSLSGSPSLEWTQAGYQWSFRQDPGPSGSSGQV
ncbi:velvet factor-domain-containing protein [Cerioporus squamosus]|nr:velvet factor-domain-containing protein [Cerioporus squamosus]